MQQITLVFIIHVSNYSNITYNDIRYLWLGGGKIMKEGCLHEVLTLLSTYIFKECNELGRINLAQIHSIINILVKANIPFNLKVTEGTREIAKSATLTVFITPTLEFNKLFQLEEGDID